MRVRLTNPDARVPERKNPTDAGADLFSPVDITVPAHGEVFINLGFQIELLPYTAGFIFARSGLGSKHGIRPRNCVGVVDSDYRGDVGIMVENHGSSDYHIKKGDRIAQLVMMPVITGDFWAVDELSDTGRGAGGFGSTGK